MAFAMKKVSHFTRLPDPAALAPLQAGVLAPARPGFNPRCGVGGDARAFTLIELLTVVGIISILMALIAPAITGMSNNAAVTKAAYDIDGILDQARSYAMANNDYVFVGFEEVNAAISDSAVPQQAATAAAGGRLAVVVLATRDETSSLAGGNLYGLQKLARFENIHLADFTGLTAQSGPMSSRAVIDGTNSISLGNSLTNSTQTIAWPVGATTPQYQFTKIIQFNSQGVASIPGIAAIPQYIEIALQQTHGSGIPAAPANLATGNQVAIQEDGITGALHIYRP
jgi:prepilin-type N-terminal cleavage/methylation domain-containing protein